MVRSRHFDGNGTRVKHRQIEFHVNIFLHIAKDVYHSKHTKATWLADWFKSIEHIISQFEMCQWTKRRSFTKQIRLNSVIWTGTHSDGWSGSVLESDWQIIFAGDCFFFVFFLVYQTAASQSTRFKKKTSYRFHKKI